MKLTMRATATLGKKVTLITAAFVLAVSTLTAAVPFILSQKVNAMGTNTVSDITTFQAFKDALNDSSVGYINLASHVTITAPEELVLSRSDVRINGNDSTIVLDTATSALPGWKGDYVFQAYNVSNVEINSLRVSGGDAGFLINSSEVILKGNTHVDGHEFGGIEVSRGSAPGLANSQLTLQGGLWSESAPFETQAKPSVWVIDGQGSVNSTALHQTLTSASYIAPGKTYLYRNAALSNSVATNTTLNRAYDTVAAAVADAANSNTVRLDKNVTLTEMLFINKPLTFEGNNKTLTASYSFTKNGVDNSVVTVNSNDVTIKNLATDNTSAGEKPHGIVVQEVAGVSLSNVTLQNGRAGLIVNGSKVSANGIHTSGNSWYGVNIDRPGAVLTISGNNSHTEPADLWVDDRADGQIVDVNNKYEIALSFGATDIHNLDVTAPAVPTHVSPAADARMNTNNFWFDWNGPSDAERYEIQNSQSDAVNSDGSFQNVQWTGDYAQVQPSDSQAESRGANGTWYWQVRSIDAAGNASAWTTPWAVTIDMDKPTADIIFPTAGPSATSFQVKFNEAVNQADAQNPANYFLSNWPGAGGSGDLVGDATITYNTATTTATVSFTNSAWHVSPEQKWEVKNIRDLAGNVLADTSEYSTPLVAPTLTGPTVTSAPNTLDQSWTWSAFDPTDSTNASGLKGYEYAFVAGTGAPTTWTATSDTSFSTTVPGEGIYRLYVRAYDNAGNVTENYSEVKVDVTIPIVEITSFTSTRVAGTTEAGATVTIKVDNEDPVTVVADQDGLWSYTISPRLTTGSHTVTVNATDGINTSETVSRPLTVPAPVVTAPVTEPPVTPPADDTVSEDNGDGNVFPSAAGNIATILGTDTNIPNSTTNNDSNGGEGVEGASSQNTLAQAVDTDSTDGTVFGLAWYWWLLILAGIALVLWWIIAALRRRQSQDA